MDAEALHIAAEVCRLAQAPDLVSWLQLPYETEPGAARDALDQKRRWLQTMQGNTKFKELATTLLRGYRKLDELLSDVQGYLAAVYQQQSSEQLPYLELAVDAVLADGVLTPEEIAFVRDLAGRLGIGDEPLNRMLREKCSAVGISFAEADEVAPLRASPRLPLRTMHMSHRAAGTGWWDEGFTRLLARHVPPEARLMLDLGCGLGWAGLSLLPSLPNLRYHGVDDTPLNVEVATRNLQSSGFAARGRVEHGDPAHLSTIGDGTVDVVLSIMNLERYPDSRPVFAEAARVLKPGGRMIVIEPDGLSQQFWFDGPLPVFNERFRELCERANALVQGNSPVEDPLGQPGIAIGPHLGARLRAAGLKPDIELVHLVQVAQQASFASFARRMRKRVEAMQTAAGMSEGDPALRDTQEAIRRLEHAHLDGLPGSGVHGLPLFLVVGFKP